MRHGHLPRRGIPHAPPSKLRTHLRHGFCSCRIPYTHPVSDNQYPTSRPSPATGDKPAPTFLDGVERVLLRIILAALIILALLLGFAAWHTRHQKAAAAAAAPASTAISVLVDFGDGSQKRLADLSFTKDMTVLDAMKLAGTHPRPIVSEIKGVGDRAQLMSIDGQRDEGIEKGIALARCWQYWVNTQYGMTSIGVAKLQAGDRVSWAYRPYESDPKPPPQ